MCCTHHRQTPVRKLQSIMAKSLLSLQIVVTVVIIVAFLFRICHAHSECSVLIGLGQHRACNTKYCKLEALYYRGGEKWTVELTCATECTNVTTNDLYYIFTMSCCSLSTCVWNQEDNVIFMNGQIPAPKVTSTTTLVSLTPSSTTPPSIIILPSVSPSTTPKSYNSFMKAMRKIPIWGFALFTTVCNLLSIALIIVGCYSTRYHKKWMKNYHKNNSITSTNPRRKSRRCCTNENK